MHLSKRFKIVELFDLVHNRNSLMLLANLCDLKFVKALDQPITVSKDLKYRTIVVKGDYVGTFHPLWMRIKHRILKNDILIESYLNNSGIDRLSLHCYVTKDDRTVSILTDLDVFDEYSVEGLSIDHVENLAMMAGAILLKQIEFEDFEEDDFD